MEVIFEKERVENEMVRDKVITIDSTNSIVEGNLVEIPFVYFGKNKDRPTLIQYRWTDSKGVERVVEVEGSKKYGLPTPYEFDVMLALLRLRAIQKPIPYGKCLFDTEVFSEEDLRIEFTLNDIAKQLGKTSTGAVLKRIKTALLVLAHTRFMSVGSRVFYDKALKEYIEDEKGIVSSVFNSYRWNTRKSSKGEKMTDKNVIQINEFFYRSIVNSYFKYFDFNQYLSLGKNNVAKRLFLLLCKWRNGRDKLLLKLETVYQRLPLDEDKPVNKKNEIIRGGLNCLEKNGCIVSYKVVDKKVEINFVEDEVSESIHIKEDETILSKYNLFTQIQDRLYELGLNELDLIDRMNFIFANVEYVKAFLRYYDTEIERKEVGESGGSREFVLQGLRLPMVNVDERYYNRWE